MIATRRFGEHDGREVTEAVLQSASARVSILNFGCIMRDWRVAGRDHAVILGFDRFDDYLTHARSHGVIAGRVANRTAFGRFSLNGTDYQLPANNGPHHLHGGPVGLQRRVWDMETDSAAQAVRLTYSSPDGEAGYPGNVDFRIDFALDGARLTIDMAAMPDRPTPINLAQHNYYNLNGRGDVRGHWMHIAADQYTPVDDGLIPTGALASVAGTQLDFRSPARIGDVDPGRIGFDTNLVLRPDRDRAEPSASVWSDESGLKLRVWTDEPGLQLFNGPKMTIGTPGLDGTTYGPFGGLCLEAQHWPDALNKPHFPSIIRSPGAPYRQRLMLDIGPAA